MLSMIIGAAISLSTSWLVADRYFKRQISIDKAKEAKDVELSYTRLVHAYFGMYGKRLKKSSHLHEAMSELQTKLKIYRPEFDAEQLMIKAGEQAKQTIADNPDDFENIEPESAKTI